VYEEYHGQALGIALRVLGNIRVGAAR